MLRAWLDYSSVITAAIWFGLIILIPNSVGRSIATALLTIPGSIIYGGYLIHWWYTYREIADSFFAFRQAIGRTVGTLALLIISALAVGTVSELTPRVGLALFQVALWLGSLRLIRLNCRHAVQAAVKAN